MKNKLLIDSLDDNEASEFINILNEITEAKKANKKVKKSFDSSFLLEKNKQQNEMDIVNDSFNKFFHKSEE